MTMLNWYHSFVEAHQITMPIYWIVGVIAGLAALVLVLHILVDAVKNPRYKNSAPRWTENPLLGYDFLDGVLIVGSQLLVLVVILGAPVLMGYVAGIVLTLAYVTLPYLVIVAVNVAVAWVAIWRYRDKQFAARRRAPSLYGW